MCVCVCADTYWVVNCVGAVVDFVLCGKSEAKQVSNFSSHYFLGGKHKVGIRYPHLWVYIVYRVSIR